LVDERMEEGLAFVQEDGDDLRMAVDGGAVERRQSLQVRCARRRAVGQ
jgi:hypothetical protein